MNHGEPPVLLHNMSGPPRTAVNTNLPVLCRHGSKGHVPLFSLPHALKFSGHLQPGRSRFKAWSDLMNYGGPMDDRLWTEEPEATPHAVSRRWPTPAALLRYLGFKEVPPLPAGLHFLIGTELSPTQRMDVLTEVKRVPGRRQRPSPPSIFRIVPDPVLTLGVISRFCGGVLYGSRTPELDYTRLTGTALTFDDPFLRDLCFPNPTSSES